jgi:hypothetical protein
MTGGLTHFESAETSTHFYYFEIISGASYCNHGLVIAPELSVQLI